ncbi:MAG: SMP-30/gluconolactonase/LRE family protein [Alphaproteobacteria bacterium]|nr:SMP-30/gluconolactonase/LRE family protein [Alphaproteobacteria bacterium]
MSPRWAGVALALALAVSAAGAEPVVVASGSYPEGLLWHGGRMYFAEMGADRVSAIEGGGTREFWRAAGCGPTSIVPFGDKGYLVNCHLSHELVEISAAGVTLRRFPTLPGGERIQHPNASASDGRGGAFVTLSGLFSPLAPATGRVIHVSASGAMSEVVGSLHYANGVAFDAPARMLYVSEHLGRRIAALALDAHNRVSGRRVLVDFKAHDATRTHAHSHAGPDGLALRPGILAVAEYGEGRVHLFDREGRHLSTLKVATPFVDTVAFDEAGNLYAGGSFQILRAPYEGAVVRFAPADWQPRR